MSYTNNWVRNLSEAYINNNQSTNLQEQLDEQVELNEQLMNLIEALCKELGIDVEALLDEAYEARMKRLRTAYEKGIKSGKDVSGIQQAAAVNAAKRERRLRSIGSKVATEPGLDKMFKAGQAVSWNRKLLRGKLLDQEGNIPHHLRSDS
jgi:transcription initiation factor TFIIIB Brf1 subunit/transcription initiation factor TFIIB